MLPRNRHYLRGTQMNSRSQSSRKRAIVIGGSIAGLLAARVLSDFYENVTIIERDRLPLGSEHRRGTPHGRHSHAILAGGLSVIEELFPGISKELVESGAVSADPLNDGSWFFEGGDLSRAPAGITSLLLSRPFLEAAIRQRIREMEQITILDGRSVRDLIALNGRVTGVHTDFGTLSADLVIDTSGRGSKSSQWLNSLGFASPRQEEVEVRLAYTTRIFRRRSDHLGGDSFAVIPPTPDGKRGGVALAQEHDRWTVTLFGHFGQQAPEGLDGFREYARSLPAPHVYNVVRDAEPIGDAVFMRFPASSRRRFEELDRFPDGYLVFGDAICSFNPIYGQGMSVAALQAAELGQALENGDKNLARRFFKQAAKVIDNPWNIAVGGDLKMPETPGPRALGVRLINWYIGKLHKCAHRDPAVAAAFIRVAQLIDTPSALMQPRMAWRVLTNTLRNWLSLPEPAGAREVTMN